MLELSELVVSAKLPAAGTRSFLRLATTEPVWYCGDVGPGEGKPCQDAGFYHSFSLHIDVPSLVWNSSFPTKLGDTGSLI